MKNIQTSSRFLSFTKFFSVSGSICSLLWIFYILLEQFPLHSTEPIRLPSSNSPIELYSNQTSDDLTSLFTSAIAKANESVTLIIYSLTDPDIIQALNKKGAENIPVYIACDAKASPKITSKLENVQLVKCFGEGFMHQKILIIDEKFILLGSANFTPSSLRTHGNLVMGIENSVLACALTKRSKSMNEERIVSSPLLHCESQIGSQNIELWILPDDPGGADRIISLLRSAKKTIKVAMFTWTRTDFTKELIAASQRGVKVETVIDRNCAKGANSKVVKMLQKSGIPFQLHRGQGLLHHKFAYIDDEILVNGSANWTKNAFDLNDDSFVVLYPLTEEQKCKMNTLWEAVNK
jgi:cardiolipin synthase A/B